MVSMMDRQLLPTVLVPLEGSINLIQKNKEFKENLIVEKTVIHAIEFLRH